MPWAARVPEAGGARDHRQRDRRRRRRPATRRRSRRSASTCRTTRRSARSTAASRCRCSNVNEAYDKSTSVEFRSEFAWSAEEAARAEKWSSLAGELTTDLHEVIGHASGRIAERLKGSPQSVLKEQYSALEESRADLVALYFLPDPRMVELGLIERGRPGRDRAAPSTRATRATRSCSSAACARARRSRKTTCATAR